MRVALLRHGRTGWNAAGRLQGRTDIPLSDDERDRLATLALPPGWRDADILSSPLSRARETAEILVQAPVATDPALIELNLGAWEGKRGVDLLADPASGYRHVEAWGWDGRPPGGETPRELLTDRTGAGRFERRYADRLSYQHHARSPCQDPWLAFRQPHALSHQA